MFHDEGGVASANPRGGAKLSQALLEERLQEATVRGEQLSKEGTPGSLANLEVLQRSVDRMVGQLEEENQGSERKKGFRGLKFYKSGAKQVGESFRPTAGLGSATPRSGLGPIMTPVSVAKDAKQELREAMASLGGDRKGKFQGDEERANRHEEVAEHNWSGTPRFATGPNRDGIGEGKLAKFHYDRVFKFKWNGDLDGFEMAADLLTKGNVGAIAKFLELRGTLLGAKMIVVRRQRREP